MWLSCGVVAIHELPLHTTQKSYLSTIFFKKLKCYKITELKLISGIWVKGSLMTKLSTGIAMVPRGEVGLIFAEVGKKSGIFNDLIYAIIVFLVALTTLVAPVLLRFVMRSEE